MTRDTQQGAQFPLKTDWTNVVDPAGQGDLAALQKLCEAYWYPLYAYLRRWGKSSHDAQDLIQGFLIHILAPGPDRLSRVDRTKGRFRSWLITCLKRYSRDTQPPREPGSVRNPFPLDFDEAEQRYQHEPIDPQATPDVVADQTWGRELLSRAMAALEGEMMADGKSAIFQALKVFLGGRHPDLRVADAAATVGLSPNAANIEISRMRGRMQELIRAEVARTVTNLEELEEELAHLMNLW